MHNMIVFFFHSNCIYLEIFIDDHLHWYTTKINKKNKKIKTKKKKRSQIMIKIRKKQKNTNTRQQ